MSIFKRGRVYWFHFFFDGQHMMEARVRIELTYKGFADLSLTTWVPRRSGDHAA